MTHVYLVSDGGAAEKIDTPLGVLLLTQCCDLARSGNGHAHVAAVVRLDPGDAANARSGRTPRYIALDIGHAENLFGDLGVVGGMTHAAAVKHRRVAALSAKERHLVGARVARRFSRFAYPDEVMPLLGWVVKKIRDKARSKTSPLGRVLNRIESIRVEIDGDWSSPPPWSISLLLIVGDGELPSIPEEPHQALGPRLPTTLTSIAESIAQTGQGAPGLSALWDAFCDRLAGDAMDASRISERYVAEFRVEVVEESELSYARYGSSLDRVDLG